MKVFDFKGMAVLTIMAASTFFVSCTEKSEMLGGLDTIISKSDAKKASIATSQPKVYFAESMLADYDITATIDGKQITLTSGNTKPVTFYGYSARVYEGETKKVTEFPYFSKAKVRATVKEGRTRSDFVRNNTDFLLFSTFDLHNNGDDNFTGLGTTKKAIGIKHISDYMNTSDEVPAILKDRCHSCSLSLYGASSATRDFELR